MEVYWGGGVACWRSLGQIQAFAGVPGLEEDSHSRTGSEDRPKDGIGCGRLSEQQSREGGRKHRHRTERHSGGAKRASWVRLFWEFRLELLALVLFFLGVFLLLEQFKIRTKLRDFVVDGLGFASRISARVLDAVSRIEQSDIVGIALLVGATGLIGFVIRMRVLRWHERIEAEPLCAKCGKQMHRSRTSRFQQSLGTAFRVRIRRFSCSKCGYRFSIWRPPHDSDW